MLWGEEWGLRAWWVFRSGGHQLDRSHMFVSQLLQTSLSVLDHLLHCCVLFKRFLNLSLTERHKGTKREKIQRTTLTYTCMLISSKSDVKKNGDRVRCF